MKRYLYLVLLLFMYYTAVAQSDERIILQGKVTNDTEVEGIHILNTSSRYNSVTDRYGNFSITVEKGDTLLFSSVKYIPEKQLVDSQTVERGILLIELEELVNQLDEVVLGPQLSGILKTDIEKVKVREKIHFSDLGIPGFQGVPQERIVPLASALFPTSVKLEAIYKHITGYYKKLRLKRQWEAQNNTVSRILDHYGEGFFVQAYQIPQERTYDFVLYCVETSTIAWDFSRGRYSLVLDHISRSATEYLSRTREGKE